MDAWDAIQDNEFFSVEGIIFAFSQMFQVHQHAATAAATAAVHCTCSLLAEQATE